METQTSNSRVKTASLSELHRALYLAVSSHMPKSARNDPDAVKPLRDHLTMELFGKIYDEMTEQELIGMISNLNAGLAGLNNLPSARQLSTLKYYMFAVGLVYANFDNWEYIDKSTGAILSGEELRSLCIYQFYEGDKKLPPAIMRRMFEECINPKTNTFLMEGKFEKIIRDPKVMYYERLSKDRVAYLIVRYGKVYDNIINKSVKPVRARLN